MPKLSIRRPLWRSKVSSFALMVLGLVVQIARPEYVILAHALTIAGLFHLGLFWGLDAARNLIRHILITLFFAVALAALELALHDVDFSVLMLPGLVAGEATALCWRRFNRLGDEPPAQTSP